MCGPCGAGIRGGPRGGDALFASRAALDDTSLEHVATRFGLDLACFRRVLRSREADAVVAADVAEVTRLGLRGTPTLLVNGRRVIGAWLGDWSQRRLRRAGLQRGRVKASNNAPRATTSRAR